MINRTLCDVLAEARKCYETRNFSYLLGLLEEAQSAGNRMEAGLGDKRDYRYYQEKVSKIKKELKEVEELQKDVAALRAEHKKLTGAIKKAEYEYKKATKGDTKVCGTCQRPFINCECHAE